jgi:AcrR family transcriptional regulator
MAPSTAVPTKRRSVPARTQEERRAETRAKLLDATLRSIAERGIAATTSRQICELAGVSSGAQTYHFPLRTDLLGAAIEHAAEQRIAALRSTLSDLPTDRSERIGTLLDLWWGDFDSTIFDVFVKLWVAAQDDPELHARLVPAERRLSQAIAALRTEILGNEDEPLLQERLEVVAATLRGLALLAHFEPRARRRRDPWPAAREQLLHMLLAP